MIPKENRFHIVYVALRSGINVQEFYQWTLQLRLYIVTPPKVYRVSLDWQFGESKLKYDQRWGTKE